MIYLFILLGIIVVYFIVAATIKLPPFKKKEVQNTSFGISISSDIVLSAADLNFLDSCYSWAKSVGLKAPSNSIILKVIRCETTPAGNWGYKSSSSPTGWAGADTSNFAPPIITLCAQNLENFRHELFHAILFERTGSPDSLHSSEEWKILGLF